MIKEVNACGVYLSPFFLALVVTLCIYVPARWLWDRIHLQRYAWNRPVFEIAVFIILLRIVAVVLWQR